MIGNQQMVRALAQQNKFWQRLLDKWDDVAVYGADEILDEPKTFDSLVETVRQDKEKGIPSICSYKPGDVRLSDWIALLTAVEAPRKLFVMPSRQPVNGGFIVREDRGSPPLFVGQGHVCLPVNGGWSVTKSPNVGRVLWRVGFSHLAEEEVNPLSAAKVFQCPKCAPGKLVLQIVDGTFRLACDNQQFRCLYHRPLTLYEATMKVRLAGVTCCQEHKHPMTARRGGNRFFMGCENWPDCQCQSKPLRGIAGM